MSRMSGIPEGRAQVNSENLLAAAPIIKKALDALGPTIRRGAGSVGKNLLDRTIADLQIGFAPYLNTSYERCRYVKTLLSQDRPIQVQDLYVQLNLDCGDDHLKDENLVQSLESYRHIMITGLAGCGKSMFMKYLTICRFENSRGMVPVFVELREMNELTTKNLLAFVHQSSASAANRITYDQFIIALRAGGLLLILDGFDEIDFAHRDAIAKQIIEASRNYPNAPIVISSRPDDRFSSWQDFYTFSVRALDKKQALTLIDRIDHDKQIKKRFRREVNDRLFRTHQSFLSSPLLASIMLLTYEQFAEIPTKVHIFYEQAFSALFRRHDAQKAQFVRKTYANLALDDFKSFFSAFCAFSYLGQRFSFSEAELNELIMKSLSYTGISANNKDVIKDLHECLCMLQQDGVHTTFVHRSFQEYFCAVFMSMYRGDQLLAMLDRLVKRSTDQAFPMLFEMARDKIDRDWIIPHIDDMLREADGDVDAATSTRIYNRIIGLLAVGIVKQEDLRSRVQIEIIG